MARGEIESKLATVLKEKSMNTIILSDSDSSSSDNSISGQPVAKQPRKRRDIYSQLISKKPPPSLVMTDIYSSQVSKCFNNYRTGKIDILLENSENESDVEEEIKISRKNVNCAVQKSLLPEPLHCFDSEIDKESEGEHNVSSNKRENRSPTPPPSPPRTSCTDSLKPIFGSRRFGKNVMEAIRNLETENVQKRRLRKKRSQTTKDHQKTVCIIDEDSDDMYSTRKEVVVKVKVGTRVIRFPLKVHELFSSVFKQLAKQESVTEDRIMLLLRDTTIFPNATPASLNLHVADIIDCYILHEPSTVIRTTERTGPDVISVNLQGCNHRSRIALKIGKHEPLQSILYEYALHHKLDVTQLRLKFDGEDVSPQNAPAELNLEEGDCLDVLNV